MSDEKLIERVRIAKAKGIINEYSDIMEAIKISKSGLYCWLANQYRLSETKKELINKYLIEKGLPENG